MSTGKFFRFVHSTAFRRPSPTTTSKAKGSNPRRTWTKPGPITTISLGAVILGATAVGVAQATSPSSNQHQSILTPDPSQFPRIPRREEQLSALKDSANKFDVLIIGGGASGAGCALDAASRGLKVALVERDDFACGTSSRSTKLVHGGVRYLEKAFRVLFHSPGASEN